MSLFSSFIARILFLKVWMNRSANPFVAGWYGADLKYLIPLRLINVANSSEENWLPLSDTICAGIPLRENIDLRTSIVFVDVVVYISTSAGHFEWASTKTKKNILIRNGPAKSMCTLSYGEECHSQGCNGAMADIFWFFWHPKHCFANFLMSLSIPGHQTELWANVFILTTHVWLSCNIFKICLRSLMGTMTHMPRVNISGIKLFLF